MQLPIKSNSEEKEVLIYNKNRDIEFLGSIPDSVMAVINTELKSFWYAILVDDENIEGANKMALLNKAPWQKW